MTKFTVREDLRRSVCIDLYYEIATRPVGNYVSSTVDFKWECGYERASPAPNKETRTSGTSSKGHYSKAEVVSGPLKDPSQTRTSSHPTTTRTKLIIVYRTNVNQTEAMFFFSTLVTSPLNPNFLGT